MTTLNWLKSHLSNMFCPCDKHISYTHGYMDRVFKSENSFDYTLWNTIVFSAYNKQCKNKMALSYAFYPFYASATRRDRLNMIANILHVPVRFHLEDDCLYADDMKCDFVLVYPDVGKSVYYVHTDTDVKNDYEIIKTYNKKE